MTTDRTLPPEIGVTGLKHFGGHLQEEFLVELQGARGRKAYQEMASNDPVIGALLFAIEMPFREVEWFFEPSSEEDREAADFLNGAIQDMSLSWSDFMTQVLTMLTYGWAYFEVVYKRRQGPDGDAPSKHSDGKIGWRKFAFRAQDTLDHWEFDESGGLKGMWQSSQVMGENLFIPIERSILFRTRSDKGNPEGKSVLRSAYRSWYFRKNLEMLEAIALERMGAGFPVIYLPESWTAADLTAAKDAVRRMRVDEQMGLTFPGPKATGTTPGWLFELIAPPASRGVATGFAEAIIRYRSEILMSTLSSFIALGTNSTGSFALSKDQRDFFQIALEGWADMTGETFDRFASPVLLELNNMKVSETPKLKHTDIGQVDLQTIANYLQAVGPLGYISPDENLEEWLRRAASMPPKLEGEEEDLEIPEEEDDEALDIAQSLVKDFNLGEAGDDIVKNMRRMVEGGE